MKHRVPDEAQPELEHFYNKIIKLLGEKIEVLMKINGFPQDEKLRFMLICSLMTEQIFRFGFAFILQCFPNADIEQVKKQISWSVDEYWKQVKEDKENEKH